MATAQVSSLLVAPRKRGHDALSAPTASVAPGASPSGENGAAKRRCRAPATVDSALRHFDGLASALYSARRAALAATGVPDAVFARMLSGLEGDVRAFLRIVDANVAWPGVKSVLDDCGARGVELGTIGVRAHHFVLAERNQVLAGYAGFYGEEKWPRDVATFVAREVMSGDRRISISVLSGGGVRDVLMADFCRAYGITARRVPMHLVIVTGESGRSFLVPYVPGSWKQW